MGLYLKKLLFKIKSFLKMENAIAGLEIKDAALRIAQFQSGNLKKTAVILEPGIIEDGRVKDKLRLLKSLKKLHSQFAGVKEKIPVIAIIPSSNVYTQVFNTPILPIDKLAEAAKLNLASISPIDLKTGYADWQQIGTQEGNSKVEILGAFASSSAIGEYTETLIGAGFIPVAVEFPALALARTIKELASGIDIRKPQVVLNVSSDGIDFIVLRQGNLYFEYFTPWKLIKGQGMLGREILFSDFKETIIRELKKVAAFYGSRWEGKLDKLVLVTQALDSEISSLIKENFNFQVIDLKLSRFINLPPSWFGVLGGALRGNISRSRDNLISLMAVGTEEEYLRAQIMFFVKSWRSIFLSTLSFILLAFVLVDSFLYRSSSQLQGQLQEISSVPRGSEIVELQDRARSFNQIVDKAALAKERSLSRARLFSSINSLVTKGIGLTRIFVDAEQSSVLLTGMASDQVSAVNFKNSLIESGFEEVSLPLSSIIVNPDKSVSFTIMFKL